MLPSKTELEAERCRRSLYAFVRQLWPWIEPAAAFTPGFHLELICAVLEAVAAGEIRRLLITLPPRHGKSLLTAVAFPAWAWITRPETRFMFACYGIDLAVRDSLRTRRLIESIAYQERWGAIYQLTGDQNAKHRFENNRGGVRLSTSVAGAATGEGGDIIVIDDPIKIDDASSQTRRETVAEWFAGTIATRLNDPRTGAIIVIGQRTHEDDLFGILRGRGGWRHLNLPAEYDMQHPHLDAADPRSEPGELLWPEQVGPTEIARMKAELGSYRAAALLQQLPAPVGGGILQRRFWRYYDPKLPPSSFQEILQSWDLSFTDSLNSDYVVGQVWGIHQPDDRAQPDAYLLRQTRGRLDFPKTIEAIEETTRWASERYGGGHAILVEEAANGHAVISHLRHRVGNIIPVRPDGSKINRVHAVTPAIEAGHVWLPGYPNADGTSYDQTRTPESTQALIEEAAGFPNGSYDDQVDALTQVLHRVFRPSPRVRVIRPRPSSPLPLSGYRRG